MGRKEEDLNFGHGIEIGWLLFNAHWNGVKYIHKGVEPGVQTALQHFTD